MRNDKIVKLPGSKICKNRSLIDKSMKFGVKTNNAFKMFISYRAITESSRISNGSHFFKMTDRIDYVVNKSV